MVALKRYTSTTSAVMLAMLLLMGFCQGCSKEEEVKTVTDIDGNTYNTLQIGPQTWMVENLMTGRYRNGDTILTTLTPMLDISQEHEPAYQWPYDGNERNVHVHGRLYTWYVITDTRNICPAGWHVPSDAELTALENFVGGIDVTGSLSGFLGGYRSPEGVFDSLGLTGYWWTATAAGDQEAWIRRVNEAQGVSARETMDRRSGFAVKCLKD